MKVKKLSLVSKASSDSPVDLNEELQRLGLQHADMSPGVGLIGFPNELESARGLELDEPGTGLDFTEE